MDVVLRGVRGLKGLTVDRPISDLQTRTEALDQLERAQSRKLEFLQSMKRQASASSASDASGTEPAAGDDAAPLHPMVGQLPSSRSNGLQPSVVVSVIAS